LISLIEAVRPSVVMTEPVPPRLLTDDEIKALLKERIDTYRLSVGISLGITDSGQRRFVSFGSNRHVPRGPVDADTIFEIGSVTKLFTVLLLADMAHRGEISIDDPVAKHLPSHVHVPMRGGQVMTLAHLACHTSGLPRIPHDIDAVFSANPYAGYSVDRLYEFLGSCALSWPSGQREDYSNLGMGLLGHVLSLRAGTDYESLLKARICTPLGMANTSIALSSAMEKALATGHDDSLDPVPNWDLGVLAGAGGLRSNVSDLLSFLEAFDRPAPSLAAAIDLFKAPVESGGLGRRWPTPDGHTLIHHEGHTGGYNAFVGYIPEWRRGVVVLANGYPAAASALGRHLLDPRCGDLWFRREADVDPGQFDRLLGTYRISPHFALTVMQERDRLYVQATGQRRIRVFPASAWHYFCKAVGAQLTFEAGPDGRVARLILHQNGRDQIAVPVH
jgi:D-alanyl-D-alanine-carboxypeptidase/D-alanyl-D-alanine-endopeptidase